MSYYYEWKPYVSVAKRRANARKQMDRLRKKGVDIQPVEIAGRKIAATFWGAAWCDHMESQGDFENRMPRGRTYVRNGSVCHLAIAKGRIDAKVSGSEMYNVSVKVDVLPRTKWKQVQQKCAGQIGSLLELLQGRIAEGVMDVVTDPKDGLFPLPKEIRFNCDCPDYATMCKHVAAVMYGIGARLDDRPELLFLLRGVDHTDLISAPADESIAQTTKRGGKRRRQVADADLADVFGIDIEESVTTESSAAGKKKGTARRGKKGAEPATRRAATDARPATRKKKTAAKSKKPAAATQATKKPAKRPKQAAKKKNSSAKAAKQQATKSGKRKNSGKQTDLS